MKIDSLLENFITGTGRITVLTGAGISAESGIPTFRGPEGYWTVGSKEYRPEQMATFAMFSQNPWEVWAWYLYRWTVCNNAAPNSGHRAVVQMEALFKDRFKLVTQNVDGLHLKAGNSEDNIFQIHGNLNYVRCSKECTPLLLPFPKGIGSKAKNQPVTEEEKERLTCPNCGHLLRPHVLWFDECYNEIWFKAESAMEWATKTELLLVVGTAGATNLPMQIGMVIARNPNAIVVDINPEDNPFRQFARRHPRGIVMEGTGGKYLHEILSIWHQDPL
ncbi:MAG: RNA polymerase subunit sigma [Desulfobacterales bacterium]|nr:MAG: RNA polymerase subunit sigma [Desulfobacterales bacterium]